MALAPNILLLVFHGQRLDDPLLDEEGRAEVTQTLIDISNQIERSIEKRIEIGITDHARRQHNNDI